MKILQIILFFVGFPLLAISFIKKKREKSDQLLSREVTRYLQGLAAFSVVIGHYIFRLDEINVLIPKLYCLSAIGTISVSILFFISGYGIYESHRFEKQKTKYLIKKIFHLLVPYWTLGFIEIVLDSILKINEYCLRDSFLYIIGIKNLFWFIWVLVVIYFAYFFISQINKSDNVKLTVFIITILLFSALLALAKVEPFWYRNNIFFAVGMLISKNEKKIVQRKVGMILVLSLFGLLALGCACYQLDNPILKIFSTGIIGMGCILILIVFFQKYVPDKYNVMFFLGNKTIYVYLLHTYLYVRIKNFWDMTQVIPNVLYYLLLVFFVVLCSFLENKILLCVSKLIKSKRKV